MAGHRKGKDGADHLFDVFLFVIGGDDYKRPAHAMMNFIGTKINFILNFTEWLWKKSVMMLLWMLLYSPDYAFPCILHSLPTKNRNLIKITKKRRAIVAGMQ
jgi:hypothetical protein